MFHRSRDPIAEAWDDPVAKFWYRLHNERVDGIVADPIFLKSLRNNWEAFCRIQKIMGYVFEERGLSLCDLVMEACLIPNENLKDDEDEQKLQSLRESPAYARRLFEKLAKPRETKKSLSGGLLHLLPRDLVRLVEIFVGQDPLEPEPEAPVVVPEWDGAGHYGSLPTVKFPLFA